MDDIVIQVMMLKVIGELKLYLQHKLQYKGFRVVALFLSY